MSKSLYFSSSHYENHLDLLNEFAELRKQISTEDGRYGLFNTPKKTSGVGIDKVLTEKKDEEGLEARRYCKLVEEKRWSIYVGLAARRFEAWWVKSCSGKEMFKETMATPKPANCFVKAVNRHCNPYLATSNLPIDVLMVLHAFMLNPRIFYEDCTRYNNSSLWCTDMALAKLAALIKGPGLRHSRKSNINGIRSSGSSKWGRLTGLGWESPTLLLPEHGGSHFSAIGVGRERTFVKIQIPCPHCQKLVLVRPTDGELWWKSKKDDDGDNDVNGARPIIGRHGYFDDDFKVDCKKCGAKITHDVLALTKFRDDLLLLRAMLVPMPGTLLNSQGHLRTGIHPRRNDERRNPSSFATNLLLGQTGQDLLDAIASILDPQSQEQLPAKMTTITEMLERRIEDPAVISSVLGYKRNGDSGSSVVNDAPVITTSQHVESVRHLLARYTDARNSSRFGLDLVGAVHRQGGFIAKLGTGGDDDDGNSIDSTTSITSNGGGGLNWLDKDSPERRDMLQLASVAGTTRRYTRFMDVKALFPQRVVVPTLRIDLAWHTHQLSPRHYRDWTIARTAPHCCYVDHNDRVDAPRLATAFRWTAAAYRAMFEEDYYVCACPACKARAAAAEEQKKKQQQQQQQQSSSTSSSSSSSPLETTDADGGDGGTNSHGSDDNNRLLLSAPCQYDHLHKQLQQQVEQLQYAKSRASAAKTTTTTTTTTTTITTTRTIDDNEELEDEEAERAAEWRAKFLEDEKERRIEAAKIIAEAAVAAADDGGGGDDDGGGGGCADCGGCGGGCD